MANQTVQFKEKEPMDTSSVSHRALQDTDKGRPPQKVVERLDKMFQTGLTAYVDLDKRAIDALGI